MTIGEALKLATNKLKAAGISSASLDAQILLEHVTGKSREYILIHPEVLLSQKQSERLQILTQSRCKRRSITQILGTTQFYGLNFLVTPDVLSPRPETEKVVELAIAHAPQKSNLLDMGTGCGALAIALAKHRPDLNITATDISPAAIKIAVQNSIHHKTELTLIQSDIWTSLVNKSFHTVLANLPYLRNDAELTPEAAQEPKVALFGGDDGLDLYRQFFQGISSHLKPAGFVFIESDPWQQPELIIMAAKQGLTKISQDYFVLGFQSKPVRIF